MDVNDYRDAWRHCIRGDDKSWVLFRNGTCVILMQPETDLAEQARQLLAEWGPVHVGSPAADFSVISLNDGTGWVVTGHHRDILNFVGRDEVGEDATDLLIGMLGRGARDDDGEALEVVHVEDRRTA